MSLVPKELIIKQVSDKLLYITTSSNDAFQTIKSEAPKFGSYHLPGLQRHHELFVGDEYETNEVKAYLEECVGIR